MSSVSGRISMTVSVGGIAFTGNITATGDTQKSHIIDLAAGVAGAISATGVDGLATGHGIEASDLIDVHWTDATDGSHKVRRGITVDTAAANAITFDDTPAAEGDSLPAEDTAVVVSVQTEVDSDWDGDDLKMIVIQSDQQACCDLREASASQNVVKLAASTPWFWSDGFYTNPLTGNPVTKLVLSNGSTSPAVVKVGLLSDVAS